MSIHEPATLVTDCLLAVLAGWCAWRLPQGRPSSRQSVRWWSVALALTGLSALVGGLYHGLAPNFPALAAGWWRLTLLLLCFVSAAMGMSLVREVAPPGAVKGWSVAIALKLVIAAAVVCVRPAFVVAIVDYGLVMVAWAAAAVWTQRAWRDWILAAIALSVLGAVVQQLRWGLSASFNHNDVYHVIQGVAIYGFYRAGRRLGPAVP